MRLVVDIGNTNISVGIMDTHRVLKCWRLATQMHRTRDEFTILMKGLIRDAMIDLERLDSAAISCVVPPLLEPVRESLHTLVGPACLTVEPGIRIGMHVHYTVTSNVGADRIVNACAAKQFYGYPVLIIDFGTATTFCVVDTHGDYCGGAIFPGIRTISEALSSSASLLPRVSFKKPEQIVGQSTVQSMQSGLFYGSIDMIEGMIQRIRAEYPDIRTVVATGGFSSFLKNHTASFTHIDENLTLRGLDLLYDMNTGSETFIVW
ncbi:MAG TPA: type III pantothenate kinase [bacterium]|nr:type III pantothenate kinase [bacterium]